MQKKPEIVVFAGPNGSGKSTVTRLAKVIEPYINADDIKKSLNCSDLEAAQKATQMREGYLEKGIGFTFETVLSTRRNLDLLIKHSMCHFVFSRSARQNISFGKTDFGAFRK